MANLERIRTMIAEELPLWDQPSIAVGVVKDGEPRTASLDFMSAQALKTAFDATVVTVPMVERAYECDDDERGMAEALLDNLAGFGIIIGPGDLDDIRDRDKMMMGDD